PLRSPLFPYTTLFRSLAESLQRITGVSIDRNNGEGAKVSVRGFGPDYNLVTLNGRQMPGTTIEATSVSGSRSFDFSNLASEGVSGVEVFKTVRAANPAGDRKSTRLNSSHVKISYAVFCLKKKRNGIGAAPSYPL